MKKVIKEEKSLESRRRNVIMYGVRDLDDVNEIFLVLDVDPKDAIIRKFFLGNGSEKPVKVCLKTEEAALTVLRNSFKLKQDNTFKTVYVSRDRTRVEQMEHKLLVSQLKAKIIDDPGTRWIIKNGIIQESNYSNTRIPDDRPRRSRGSTLESLYVPEFDSSDCED